MNIFKGILSCTMDQNIAINCAISGWKILYLGDPSGDEELINRYNLILAMPLVPDYPILMKDIDGTEGEFELAYEDMLGRELSANFFVAILTSLFMGNNIMMYFPSSVSDFKYPSVLLNYIQKEFGIVAQSPQYQFMYNDEYNQSNLILMYSFGTIDHISFLIWYNYPYDPMLIDRLINDIRPRLNNPNDYNEKVNVINNYRNSLFDILALGAQPTDVFYHDNYGGIQC